ncbi:DUF2281 domain-containing protein [Coleofasciculus sp. E2-BRE-01]|uniref:DUF2281 domain-containing protein n=1 Tax=Coleofasciculus sp. E2-BRE-01 TaxID=3069524 RepID=UPI0033003C97
MNNTVILNYFEQKLIEKIRDLPPGKVEEVADFVDFLLRRSEQHQTMVRESVTLSEKTFAKVWDNPDDAEYDQL